MSKKQAKTTPQERPLSPHLQVYKPQMTSMLSILHRMTGMLLVLGLVIYTAWLACAALGLYVYMDFLGLLETKLGMIAMVGISFAGFYHFFNGCRHLVWDTGKLFEIGCATKAGYTVLVLAIITTGGFWYLLMN